MEGLAEGQASARMTMTMRTTFCSLFLLPPQPTTRKSRCRSSKCGSFASYGILALSELPPPTHYTTVGATLPLPCEGRGPRRAVWRRLW